MILLLAFSLARRRKKMAHISRLTRALTFGLVISFMLGTDGSALSNEPVRYLAFQIFTGNPGSQDLLVRITDIRNRIGITEVGKRHIGFILGPIVFDNTDEDVRQLISSGFDIALKTGVAVGFHIDDSMFWARMTELNTSANIEWLDWSGTPNTGRLLPWTSPPVKMMPQLCINSKDVKDAVIKRAAIIGAEVTKGIVKLHAVGKDDLFAGVIAGWETYIGRDYDTGRYLGYCALTNAGYSAKNSPSEIDEGRAAITAEFVELWASSLVKSGIPIGKVYSHTTFMPKTIYDFARSHNPNGMFGSYLENSNFSRPSTAFCPSCVPGFSTYPQAALLDEWRTELGKHGNPPWVSSEGTAINLQAANQILDMEPYLGDMFNHGAVLVNLFGWGVGDSNFPFRKATENAAAIGAYQKFIRGETLRETQVP